MSLPSDPRSLTGESFAASAGHLGEAHSWYKHLPLLTGRPFVVFPAPDSGNRGPHAGERASRTMARWVGAGMGQAAARPTALPPGFASITRTISSAVIPLSSLAAGARGASTTAPA